MENIPWLGDCAERLRVGTFEIARARHYLQVRSISSTHSFVDAFSVFKFTC